MTDVIVLHLGTEINLSHQEEAVIVEIITEVEDPDPGHQNKEITMVWQMVITNPTGQLIEDLKIMKGQE